MLLLSEPNGKKAEEWIYDWHIEDRQLTERDMVDLVVPYKPSMGTKGTNLCCKPP
jgi:hypothetical protein